ncbi:MAG TPA: SHOCT domain-containing protein [Solirubrobacterales bacterium]|nr:SHOCT domain-containing protein [Solirubrobacterales bacterium]
MTRPAHRIATRVLIALGAVLTVLAILAVWVERQGLQTDEWVETSSELLADDQIQLALQEYLVDQLFASVDVQAELEERLPPEAQALSGPAAGALRQVAGEVAGRAFDSPRVQGAWAQANRAAHELLIALVEGEAELVEAEGGTVTLDLHELVGDLALRLGISPEVADRLPPDVASLEIVEADNLELAQDVAAAVRGLAIAFSLLAFGSFALAIYLGRDRRQLMVLWSGLALIAAGIGAYAVRGIAGDAIVDALIVTEGARPAAESAWSISTSLLTSVANTVIVFGILFVLGSWLASPTQSAIAVRRALAPTLRARPGWVYGFVVAVALVYFAFAPTHGLRALLTVVILALFAVAGVAALRRQVAAEFPDGGGYRGGLAPLRSWIAGLGPRRGGSGPELADGDELRLEKLERLAGLHERGVLTDDELAREKQRLLGPAP